MREIKKRFRPNTSEKNVEEIAKRIIELYEDRELLFEMSKRIREDYLAIFNKQIMAKSWVNGVEHVGDYAFKTVLDLEYRNFDDWFIPSRDSMQAIYDNVHAVGMGDFNENLTYWTSTKVGYSPYVMNFNFDWGGVASPGLCTNANGIMIVRQL